MSEPIHLQLEVRQETINPKSFIEAIRNFWGILRDLDAAITGDPRGTISWGIESLTKDSPADIAFIGQPRLGAQDITAKIQDDCIKGLNLLTEAGDIWPSYSHAAITKIEHLAKLQTAQQRYRIDTIRIFTNGGRATVEPKTLENIRVLTGIKYESIGSIVGNLDSITVHRGNEFRVWEEVAGRPVTCRFAREKLGDVKDKLGRRVIVYGGIKANNKGQPTLIIVDEFELYPEESKLPSIEQMSGLVEDFTNGLSLKDYMEEIRNG